MLDRARHSVLGPFGPGLFAHTQALVPKKRHSETRSELHRWRGLALRCNRVHPVDQRAVAGGRAACNRSCPAD